MFDNSVIVVAHPDDEALWLSSVLDRAGGVVFCFQDCPAAPKLGPGRKKVVDEYPLANTVNLGIVEPVSFGQADWGRPRTSPFGIHIGGSAEVRDRYKKTYGEIIDRLPRLLHGCRNVFTHNPWGEYGHEDHVQVYRAVKALQKDLGFNIWYSNYCGQVSVTMMLLYMTGFSCDYLTLPTNPVLAHKLRDLYKKHRCWTWYEDYQWFKEESLMMDNASELDVSTHGHMFPVNMLKTDFTPGNSRGHRLAARMRRIFSTRTSKP